MHVASGVIASMNVESAVEYGAAPLRLGVSREFAAFAAALRFQDLPDRVVHESRRGVMDWLGCALAGSRHRTIAKLLAGVSAMGSLERVPVIGDGRKVGLMEGALVNGQMGHVLDFDDTHMEGVVLHNSSPVLAALLAAAETGSFTGRDLIVAYALSFEAGVRVGKAAPAHHDGGWHLTGTLGSISAGVAVGRLLGLDATQMLHALGIATTQAAGMQQNRGTMCKSFHAGKAASNGLLAGFLAREGFDSSDEIIEGRRGFTRIFSTVSTPENLLDGLGSDWHVLRNGHKPYACGIVLHPMIDGMVALHHRGIPAESVAAIEVVVNPATVRITGVKEPQTGLQSKFSVYHSAAVAFLDGHAGIEQYSDRRAAAPEVAALRQRVRVSTDESLRRDEARTAIVDTSGQRHEMHVEHASGTRDNPMSDAAMEEKFRRNAEPVLGEDGASALVASLWSLDGMSDVRAILRQAATRQEG
jgi:2-methylcitrate dehydratase PrpD